MALSTISGTTGITDATVTSAKLADFTAAVDLNGVELLLDADADTSISADTDDQIDIKIANTDHLKILSSSGDTVLKPMVDAKDIIFQQFDGNKVFEINDGNFVSVGGNATAAGQIRIYEDTDNGSHYSGFTVGNLTESYTLALPNADGSSGQALTTNGSGVLSFTTLSANTPSSADGQALGSASLEWSDLFLADGAVISFGNDQDVTLTHVADVGLALKHTATADDKPIRLVLQTGETDMAANDVIGALDFQAPNEGTGTDAILVAASIEAVSEGDFSSSNNATSLQLKTGASEAATAKVTIKSDGKVGIGTTTPGHDLNIVSSGNAEFELERTSGAALMFKTQSNLGVIGTTSNHSIQLMTNSAGRVTIDTNGVMTLGSGDLELQHDGSFISFGANDDVKLTHVHDTGVLLNGASVIQFRDSGLTIGSNADGDLDIVSDGTAVDSINIESAGGITLDAGTAGSGVIYEDDGTEMMRIHNSSSDVIIETKVSDKDFIIKGNDGGSVITPFTLDMSAGGDLFLTGGLIDLKNDGSAVSQIKFYCESSNAHAQTLQGAPHSESASNVLTLPSSGGNVDLVSTASTATLTNKTLTTPRIVDNGYIQFGTDNEVRLISNPDKGVILKHTATADDKPSILTLQTGETDIAANDVIGAVDFQAPDEATGTDAILVAAGIEAVSEGDFSSSANATSLVFKTGASEAAAGKIKVTSAGHLFPMADDSYDLGGSSNQWRNIYTGDLHLSNMSKDIGNIVDGSKGDWTIQEGSSDLFLINNNSGKKYKFNLTEV